ncbi:MAG: addiction module toxin, HicA family [Planctomycetota bacterium]|nr:MAG: addiction module toxin, HicA family [Planctomycetota bacterium]
MASVRRLRTARERVTKVPSLNAYEVIRGQQRDGWVVVRQRGSHIRLHKHMVEETLKITVPAHKPIKRSTLSHIIKQARLELESFIKLV